MDLSVSSLKLFALTEKRENEEKKQSFLSVIFFLEENGEEQITGKDVGEHIEGRAARS